MGITFWRKDFWDYLGGQYKKGLKKGLVNVDFVCHRLLMTKAILAQTIPEAVAKKAFIGYRL